MVLDPYILDCISFIEIYAFKMQIWNIEHLYINLPKKYWLKIWRTYTRKFSTTYKSTWELLLSIKSKRCTIKRKCSYAWRCMNTKVEMASKFSNRKPKLALQLKTNVTEKVWNYNHVIGVPSIIWPKIYELFLQ